MYVFGSGRGGRYWGEWIGFGLYQSWMNMGKVGYVCVFVEVVWVVLGGGEWMGGLGDGLILCVDGRSRYLYIVLDGYRCILGAPSVPSCFTLSISAS